MKLNLLLALLSLPIAMQAQNSLSVKKTDSSPYASGSKNIREFDNKARAFKDWSISVGGGGAFLQNSDLNSFYDNKVNFGWSGYISLDKQITNTVGLSLAYQMGKTNQKAFLYDLAGVATAWTKYRQVVLLGDFNLTSLARRVDNRSTYNWALHAYAGVGLQAYNLEMFDNDQNRWSTVPRRVPIIMEQKLGFDTFFYELGTGVLYNVNRLIDVEARVLYIVTGDDSFDGGGWNSRDIYNRITPSGSDNYFTVNLGMSFKLGKHPVHLKWFDPLQDAYTRTANLQSKPDMLVCEKGDMDNDGVCDDWDRQLDTPAGTRVDGAGVALDMDLDGVIDLYDKCVTIAGSVENGGCPGEAKSPMSSVSETIKDLQAIEFALNKDIIRPTSFEKLDNAVDILKDLDSNSKFAVIGCTDTRGKEASNQILSEKRAKAVVKYLISKGINENMLTAEGHGQNDLKYPECNPATKCPEWKNEANRRVYFQQK